jgi:hypothetical protein
MVFLLQCLECHFFMFFLLQSPYSGSNTERYEKQIQYNWITGTHTLAH